MNPNRSNTYEELLDKIALIIYEDTKKDYLECLIRAANGLIDTLDEKGLKPSSIEEIEKTYGKIIELNCLNEEIRQALELLTIKAFKHINYSLDLMTPDYINYLFSYIINKIYFDDISIMDINLGTSNMLNAISNYINVDSELYGVERDERLVRLAKVFSDLEGNEINIYYNDFLKSNFQPVDVIIGDLDNYYEKDKYFPYEAIKKSMNYLKENGVFIFLISNDFFSQNGVDKFKSEFDGSLNGLILLPNEIFKKDSIGKSILIGCGDKTDQSMTVMHLPSINEQDKFQDALASINEWIKIWRKQ